MTTLERGTLMTEEQYLDSVEEYGDEFTVRMGPPFPKINTFIVFILHPQTR